jgi:transposase
MREHARTDAHFDRPAAIPPHTHAPTSPINARLGEISGLAPHSQPAPGKPSVSAAFGRQHGEKCRSWVSSHKSPAVRTAIQAAGAELRFLPPYSPDFNPIEKAFAKLKALLRKAAERNVDGLWRTIGILIDLFTPTECANFFPAAGYEPQ